MRIWFKALFVAVFIIGVLTATSLLVAHLTLEWEQNYMDNAIRHGLKPCVAQPFNHL